MTEKNNDKLLKDFLTGNKQEIADNGFSRRVMQNLPDRSNRVAQIWTKVVLLIGALIFIFLGGFEAVWNTLKEVIVNMLNSGATATIDLKSVLIVTVVLVVLASKKIASLA